ncbi:hypothetical protein [Mycoplasma sp. E35C]|uniref:hypothetical protein n=1 Tax=Mycoplasma sp. E35C TaxID=2801918 RepID=UPI001CA3986E|nr:hypothetical protein [Mycoplasma sp. E35C]QZX48878.1 hypothetical protein JJE79_02355 [Mycoplasma sp. E35C]
MKKHNLFKVSQLFSLFFVSSILVSSCTSSIGIDKDSGENKTPPASRTQGSSDGSSDDQVIDDNVNQPVMTLSNAQRLRNYANTLDPSSFIVVDTKTHDNLNRYTTRPQDLVPDNFQLIKTNELARGWNVRVEIVSYSNINGMATINVTFSKDNEADIRSNEIQFDGFKSLGTEIADKLIKRVKLNDNDDYVVDILDGGDANFSTLKDLNNQINLSEVLDHDQMDENDVQQDNDQTDNNNRFKRSTPNKSTGLELTNGFYDSFKKANQNALDELRNEFSINDLYLEGQAVIDKIYRPNSKSQEYGPIFYYLRSKTNHPLSIKSPSYPELEVYIPGMIVRNIIPDDVELSVSSINIPNIMFDQNKQSNKQAYIDKIKSNDHGYYYDVNHNEIKIKINENQIYNVDAIKIPYIAPNNNDKILFKARYIFDGTKVDTDFFSTTIRAKKVTATSSLTTNAIASHELTAIDTKLPVYYQMRKKHTEGKETYFWNEDQQIKGEANKDNGKGVSVLINNKTNAVNAKDSSKNYQETVNSNLNEATNYILLSRIQYNTSQNKTEYYWPNKVTILHIDKPTK